MNWLSRMQGTVELRGCMAILGIETGNRRVKNPTLENRGWGAQRKGREVRKNPVSQEGDPAGEGEDRGGAGDPMRGDGGSCGAIRLCAAACA
jgi:hypothetical protein